MDEVGGTHVVTLLGYLAYMVASLVVGGRLVRLWRRTREWPELIIGTSFLSAGTLAYVAWFAVAVLLAGGAAPSKIHRVASFGLFLTVLGACTSGIGIAMIFRTGQRWAKVYTTGLGLGMLVGLSIYATSEATSMAFWWTLVVSTPIYSWGAFETLSLGLVLRKRARLGLADPLVVNRTMKWGISYGMVAVSTLVAFAARLQYGHPPPAWASALGSGLLVAAAGGIWFAFFPPAFYRARLKRASGTR
jgi:hypothetical protein